MKKYTFNEINELIIKNGFSECRCDDEKSGEDCLGWSTIQISMAIDDVYFGEFVGEVWKDEYEFIMYTENEYKDTLDYDIHTGLLLVNDVPFTKETLTIVRSVIVYDNILKAEFNFSINIHNKNSETEVTVDNVLLDRIEKFIAINNLTLASNEDFK